MTIYIVQYHDNSWGAQESEDEILGVYSSEEKATKRADEYEERIASDDYVTVHECELDEDIPSYMEYMESQCE